MPPKLSVCLPTYNGVNYLAQAIESILNQSYVDFELVICDDASKDSTFELLQKYAVNDKRIRLYRNEHNIGLFANYNKCLAYASADLIKLFAQDDLLSPTALERCIDVFEREPDVVLVSVARNLINSDGLTIDSESIHRSTDVFPSGAVVAGFQVIEKCLLPVINFVGEPSTIMYRRSAAGDGFDPSFRHLGDLDYWLRILMEGSYYHISENLCSFRCHNESSSVANALGLVVGTDLIKLSKKFSWILEAHNLSEQKFIQQCLIAFAGHVTALLEDGSLPTEYLLNGNDLRQRSLERDNSNQAERRKADQQVLTELIEFRELAFQCLKIIGSQSHYVWSRDIGVEAVKNHELIRSLESEVRMMLGSPSWRLTRVFREVNKARNAGRGGLKIEEPEIDPQGDLLAQQALYIEYLRNLAVRIKSSRSWQLTKTFRRVGRK